MFVGIILYKYTYIYWDIFNLLHAQFYNELENEDSDKHFCLNIYERFRNNPSSAMKTGTGKKVVQLLIE